MSDSTSTRTYRVNEPDVSAEDFRSEILAVDLKLGHYHSLRAAAVPIWRLLLEGKDVDTIVLLLAPVYGLPSSELAQEVVPFVARLEESHLIVPESSPTAAPDAPTPTWMEGLTPAYQPPILETYTEMHDLLMLDPIHDVDAAGWPHVAKVEADQP